MLFEFVFSHPNGDNGFSGHVESLVPENGLQILEHSPSATVVNGEWENAMSFLRQCREYFVQRKGEPCPITTVHIYG